MDETLDFQPIWQRLGADTETGRARRRALETMAGREWPPTDTVSYRSAGRVLVLGYGPVVAETAVRLQAPLRVSVLATTPAGYSPPAGIAWTQGRAVSLSGHLGDFRVVVDDGARPAREAGPFDVVLDLGHEPLLGVEVPPPGYFAPRDAQALETAVASAAELVGEFEKPRYFAYDSSICAHGRSGVAGCTRCLDTCPTGAITSLKERIEVDPYLCQGGGVCATACPTGAIRYTLPAAEQWLERLRLALRAFREAGDVPAPVLLLHDAEAGERLVGEALAEIPDRVLPMSLEEVASAGMDSWLVALAYGVERIDLLVHAQVPESVRGELEKQVHYTGAVLAGLGYDPARVRIVTTLPAAAEAPVLDAQPAAAFAALGSKRDLLRSALAQLHEHAPAPAPSAPLPDGAPFGDIVVDKQACTLCMACVSVCPANALLAGGETPALRFVEWNCVQCGLCERACPEDAITRQPRVLYDPALQRERRTLNEEAPFVCVSCGKPFATQSMMRRMREKLSGHRMFQKPEQMRRLEMCENCRVKDMLETGEMSNHH